jgi:DedD protein
MNSSSTNNLPQAVLPPKPQQETTKQTTKDEPLFEDVEVMQENSSSSDADLDKIAQKLKQESQTEERTPSKSTSVQKPTPVVKTKSVQKAPKRVTQAKAIGQYYIQVGSFSKYQPNKKFLNSITNLGFNYKYHKVGALNKVLVGPFTTQKEANRAKKVLRAKVEPGSFLVKL